MKGRHHRLERRLVFADFVGGWEFEDDTPLSKFLLQMPGDDFPQRHLGRTDFQANHLKFSRDGGAGFPHLSVGQQLG